MGSGPCPGLPWPYTLPVTLHSKVGKDRIFIVDIQYWLPRFLATEFGLAGNTNLERAQANEIVDAVSDLQTAMIKVAFSNDDAGVKNVLENVFPAGLVRTLTLS